MTILREGDYIFQKGLVEGTKYWSVFYLRTDVGDVWEYSKGSRGEGYYIIPDKEGLSYQCPKEFLE